MTRAMDGVRRTAVMQPMANVGVRRQPNVVSAAPIARTVVGMDGIRRTMPATSPRQVLENIAAVPAPPAAEAPVIPQTEARADWSWRRPAIAFGMVATALVAAGATSLSMTSTSTVMAETVKPALAAPVVQTQAPALASTPVPTPNAAALAAAQQQAGLQRLLDNFVAGQAGQYGIVVKDLKTGSVASVNGERQLISASLYKMFVAQQIYRMIDTGQITYGAPAGGGTGRNVEDCLRIMINVSDNGCGRALGSILGWGKQNEALRNAGYTETNLASGQQTSARDMALMFERLYQGTLNSPSSNKRFTDLLKDQRVNNRLPVGLPKGTVIAHKTGDLDGYVHDAGIVYGPKTDYLVVVTSGPWKAPGAAPAQFANLSSQLWNYLQQ